MFSRLLQKQYLKLYDTIMNYSMPTAIVIYNIKALFMSCDYL